MSTQITVRLPDRLVEFVDRQVAEEQVPSRAGAVAAALERERRRILAERDIRILSAVGDDPDELDSLAAYGSKTGLSELG